MKLNLMNLTIEDKNKIYDFIRNGKSKFIYQKTNEGKNFKLIKLLEDNNIHLSIDDLTMGGIFDYLTDHWDRKCGNILCHNIRKSIGLFPRRGNYCGHYGEYRFCSKKCAYEYTSERQRGANNTSHRMSDETFKGMCIKNSIKMKQNIKEGKFIPNVTNSWAKSRCDILFLRGSETIELKTRSTWDAYFQLFNTNLFYEKLIIPYRFKKEDHNYIVDFVDYQNKIIYEIKPNATAKDPRNLTKARYARKWAKNNGYKFYLIKDRWFKENYNIDIILGQPCEEKLLRNLKQFI